MSKLYIKGDRKALDDATDEEVLGQERVNDYFDQSSEERHCKPITKTSISKLLCIVMSTFHKLSQNSHLLTINP